MRFLEIKDSLAKLKIFSKRDMELLDSNATKQKISYWIKKGYLQSIKKWYYLLNNIVIDEGILFAIANKVYSPSYISLETALSYYGLIPEIVYNISSVTPKKTYRFEFEGTKFVYRTISPKLFFGYKLIKYENIRFLIAEMEKVLLDYLYLNPSIKTKEDIKGLRLNKEVLKKININKLQKYAQIFDRKLLYSQLKHLVDYIHN